MIDFDKKSMPTDLSWFARRYNALVVDFPKEITREILKSDDLCSRYDPDEALEALKRAHEFLTSIAEEMLILSDNYDVKMAVIENVFSRMDLLWTMGIYGEICEIENKYCIIFKKPLQSNEKTLPSNYTKSFYNIGVNGCYVDFFYNDTPAKDYKSCNNGILHFDDRLTALGMYIYVKKCARTYVNSFYRADMRMFVYDKWPKYDIYEQLAEYNNELIECFALIYDFVKNNHPECLPDVGCFNYVCSTVNFWIDKKHAQLGAIGLGQNKDSIGFYGAMSGAVREAAIAQFGDKLRGDWFNISNKTDAEYAIEIMKIKAKYGKNVIKKKV